MDSITNYQNEYVLRFITNNSKALHKFTPEQLYKTVEKSFKGLSHPISLDRFIKILNSLRSKKNKLHNLSSDVYTDNTLMHTNTNSKSQTLIVKCYKSINDLEFNSKERFIDFYLTVLTINVEERKTITKKEIEVLRELIIWQKKYNKISTTKEWQTFKLHIIGKLSIRNESTIAVHKSSLKRKGWIISNSHSEAIIPSVLIKAIKSDSIDFKISYSPNLFNQ